jgi:hypothetical protein
MLSKPTDLQLFRNKYIFRYKNYFILVISSNVMRYHASLKLIFTHPSNFVCYLLLNSGHVSSI